jgi:uncharacterized protein YprB with RNaseH-like and TPR domain
MDRLAALNRQSLPVVISGKFLRRPARAAASEQLSLIATENELHGEEIETPCGPHWLVTRAVNAVWPSADRVIDAAHDALANQTKDGAHEDWRAFTGAFADGVALLDIETCGFAGSMIFLIGLIHEGRQGLVLSQYFARNYAEEPAMLWSVFEQLASRRVLVTFNGKSFDWPMVNDRGVLHRFKGRDSRTSLHHIDLLHHARRRYRRELPNCRLQTLEWFLCGRRRTGDIAGREIPEAYHRYVRSGDACEMHSVLHHNALDLITLLQLTLRLATEAPLETSNLCARTRKLKSEKSEI